jgi:hypothetical protein
VAPTAADQRGRSARVAQEPDVAQAVAVDVADARTAVTEIAGQVGTGGPPERVGDAISASVAAAQAQRADAGRAVDDERR